MAAKTVYDFKKKKFGFALIPSNVKFRPTVIDKS